VTLSAPTRVRSRAARVLTTLGLLAGTVGLGVAVAGPASAHHPTITATTDCSGSVAWTSTAWDGTSGSDHDASRTNDKVQISYRLDDQDTWTPVTEGAYTKDDDFSFGGHVDLKPLPQTIELRAYTAADWGNGASGGQTTSTGALPFSNCAPAAEAKPTADVQADCGGYQVALANKRGTADAEFTVTLPDGTTEKVTVPAGGEANRTYPAPANGDTGTVTVSSGDTQLVSKEFTADCTSPAPAATVDADCTGFTVHLDNTAGTEPATFTITKVDGTTEDVVVVAAGTDEKTFPAPTEGETGTVAVASAGETIADSTFEAVCAATPSPSASPTVAGVQEVRDQPSASATPVPSAADLPNTGNPVNPWVLGAGAALVLVGGGVMLLRRRRAN